MGVWGITELAAAIVSASLPLLHPLAHRVAQAIKSTFGKGNSNSKPNQGFQGYNFKVNRLSHRLAKRGGRRNDLLAESTYGTESANHAILATTTFSMSSDRKTEVEGGERIEPAEKPMTLV